MTLEKQVFLDAIPVSHETIHNLSIYEKMLVEWSEKFNLVSASTLPHIWSRHFLDSAQLMKFIPDRAETLADMGAGAGFPGLVLAIMAKGTQRNLKIYEIESTGKKADFLQAVVDQLQLNVVIRRERVEQIRDLKVDIITARAMKTLPELLVYANHLINKDTICIFPKGQAAVEELTQAKKYWTFQEEINPSCSDDSGNVLVIRSLRYKSRR
jgi:16S rRNA (guanine527-N7)-methyltransferase